MDHESGPEGGSYTLAVEEVRFDSETSAEFRFQVLGPRGHAVMEYRLLHERELHLIVVRRDLATFSHLHPTREGDGTWQRPANPDLPRTVSRLSPTSPLRMARR